MMPANWQTCEIMLMTNAFDMPETEKKYVPYLREVSVNDDDAGFKGQHYALMKLMPERTCHSSTPQAM